MSNLSDATAKVVDVLSEFSVEERARIVRASLTLLGDEQTFALAGASQRGAPNSRATPDVGEVDGTGDLGLNPVVQQWIKRNSMTQEQLEHYFHFDEGKAIPIAIPGAAKSTKEKAIDAYLTMGMASYLSSGDASFSDAEARKFCETSGCFDGPNHAKIYKAFGNKVTGSKSTAWKLTSPGLTAVAELIKQPKS